MLIINKHFFNLTNNAFKSRSHQSIISSWCLVAASPTEEEAAIFNQPSINNSRFPTARPYNRNRSRHFHLVYFYVCQCFTIMFYIILFAYILSHFFSWNGNKHRAKIIKNEEGHRTTPSVLRFKTTTSSSSSSSSDMAIVGEDMSTSSHNHSLFAINWKRLLSVPFSELTDENKRLLRAEQDTGSSTGVAVRCHGEDGSTALLAPEVLSSYLLKTLKRSAESYLNKNAIKKQFSSTTILKSTTNILCLHLFYFCEIISLFINCVGL